MIKGVGESTNAYTLFHFSELHNSHTNNCVVLIILNHEKQMCMGGGPDWSSLIGGN